MSPTFVFNHPITSEELPPSTRTSRPRWPRWTSCSWTRRPPEHRDEPSESKWKSYGMHYSSGQWLNPPTKGWKKEEASHFTPRLHQPPKSESPGRGARWRNKPVYVNTNAVRVQRNTRTEVYSNKPRLTLSFPGPHITKTTTSADPPTLLGVTTPIRAQGWCIHSMSRLCFIAGHAHKKITKMNDKFSKALPAL